MSFYQAIVEMTFESLSSGFFHLGLTPSILHPIPQLWCRMVTDTALSC